MAQSVIRLLLAWMTLTVPVSHAVTLQELVHQQLINATSYPGYDAAVRPIPDSSGGPVIVEVDTVMNSVGPVNEMDMTWTLSCYFRQEWTDPRLVLVNSSLPRVQLGQQEVSRLWVPDVFFANSKVDRKHDITVPNHLVYVNTDTGRVLYSQRLTIQLNCEMNLEKFPHDIQYCDFDIESSGGPVIVEVDTVMNSVGPVNEMDMTWTLSCYFRQEWTDPRLVLVNSSLPRVQLGQQEVSRLWVPDVFFANSKVDRKHDITVPNHLVYVNTDTGRVLYSQSYSTDDMVLKWSSSRSATDLLPTAFIPDFAITKTVTLDCTATYAIGTFPCLKARVTLERKIGFYITQNYIPTILIVILSWASFWINHEAVPARISVGLLTVLTITTQLSGSRAQLPRVPYIKAIDVWMSMCLVFVFAAYMEYAVVTVLSRRYRKKLAGQRVRSIFKVVAERSRSSNQASLSNLVDAVRNKKKEEDSADASTSSAPSQDVDVESGLAKTSSKSHLYIKGKSGQSETPAASSQKKALPGFEKNGMDTGRMVDQFSRAIFPTAFAIFNVVYWVYYEVSG